MKPTHQPLPSGLPREETVLEPLAGTDCPECGHAMRHIRDEVNETLEYIPAHFVVKRTVRAQYGCPCCDTVHSAVLPPTIIDKGRPGPGLLAQVVISKVMDHLPLHRQQKIYAREGVMLPESTLADWFGQTAAALVPLAAALKRDLLRQLVLQVDETPLRVLNTQTGKAKNGYLWAYVSAAGSERNLVVYDCHPDRAGPYTRAMLAGWSGTLLVDGYAGYSVPFSPKADDGRGLPTVVRDAGTGCSRDHRGVESGWRTCCPSCTRRGRTVRSRGDGCVMCWRNCRRGRRHGWMNCCRTGKYEEKQIDIRGLRANGTKTYVKEITICYN